MEVYRFGDGAFLEDQDMWRMSGIFRDVYLWAHAGAAFARFRGARPTWTMQYRDATLVGEGRAFSTRRTKRRRSL